MQSRKNSTLFLICALLCVLCFSTVFLLCSCTQDSTDGNSVVCSSFVIYDWVKQVMGDDCESWELVLLGARGADVHSYQPTVKDIAHIARCELFIYFGGESESWAEDVIACAENSSMSSLALTHALEKELCTLNSGGHSHSHDVPEGHNGHDGHDGHDHEYDEHIWFSPELVYASVMHIADLLSEAKPQMAQTYKNNAGTYISSLKDIEAQYLSLGNSAPRKNIVVCDRYPFFYLGQMMGLEYAAAYEGCSAESEASFSVVRDLSQVIDKTGVGYVLVCEGSDKRIAHAAINATKQRSAQILTLDSMQSVTESDISEGVSFVSILKNNLEVLKTALSK